MGMEEEKENPLDDAPGAKCQDGPDDGPDDGLPGCARSQESAEASGPRSDWAWPRCWGWNRRMRLRVASFAPMRDGC